MQRKQLLKLLIKFCNQRGSRTFSLKHLKERDQDFGMTGIGGKTPLPTISRLLQELRGRDELLSCHEKRGVYTLGDKNSDLLLEEEKQL